MMKDGPYLQVVHCTIILEDDKGIATVYPVSFDDEAEATAAARRILRAYGGPVYVCVGTWKTLPEGGLRPLQTKRIMV